MRVCIARVRHANFHSLKTGLEASVRLAARGPCGIKSIEFMIGGMNADATWRDWIRVGKTLLGNPSGLESDSSFSEQVCSVPLSMDCMLRQVLVQAAQGLMYWEISQGTDASPTIFKNVEASGERHASMEGLLLFHEDLPEIREMLFNRDRGYSGLDIPLTAEQEVAATSRRSSR